MWRHERGAGTPGAPRGRERVAWKEAAARARSRQPSVRVLGITLAGILLVHASSAAAQCEKDTAFEGERICEDGVCAYPSRRAGPAPSAESAQEAGAATVTAALANAATTPMAADIAAFPQGPRPDPWRIASSGSPVQRPSRRFLVEVGAFGFGIHAGEAGTFDGGVEAEYRFSYEFVIGAGPEGSGTLWGAAADARLSMGFLPGWWRPFIRGRQLRFLGEECNGVRSARVLRRRDASARQCGPGFGSGFLLRRGAVG
jgi:hypothetical protein